MIIIRRRLKLNLSWFHIYSYCTPAGYVNCMRNYRPPPGNTQYVYNSVNWELILRLNIFILNEVVISIIYLLCPICFYLPWIWKIVYGMLGGITLSPSYYRIRKSCKRMKGKSLKSRNSKQLQNKKIISYFSRQNISLFLIILKNTLNFIFKFDFYRYTKSPQVWCFT